MSLPGIRAALLQLVRAGELSGREFQKVWSLAGSGAPCNIAVWGRTMEALNAARYDAQRHRFVLTDAGEAKALLA